MEVREQDTDHFHALEALRTIEPRRAPFEKLPRPGEGWSRVRTPRRPYDGCHADDQELAQIAVAHLADPSKARLAAARVLPRHEAEPGGEVPAGFELRGIRNRCGQRRSRDRADAWDRSETTGGVVLSTPADNASINVAQNAIELVELIGNGLERVACPSAVSSRAQ